MPGTQNKRGTTEKTAKMEICKIGSLKEPDMQRYPEWNAFLPLWQARPDLAKGKAAAKLSKMFYPDFFYTTYCRADLLAYRG